MFNKKRFSIIVISILIGVFTFSFQIAEKENQETILTSGIPSSGKVIVVDAGHGVPDEGDFELKL